MVMKTARRSGPLSTPVIVVAAIVILAIIYLLVQNPSVEQISSNKTVTLAVNSSFNFDLPSNSSIASIFLASASNSSALLYLSKVPVLEKEVLIVPLNKGSTVNISVYGSPNADLQVSFVSGSSKGAVISLYSIPKNLNIRPATLQFLNSTSFGKTVSTTTISSNQSTAPTTTANGASTTVAATTTVVAVNASAKALQEANNSATGTLIVNYNKLYTKAATQCTPSAYNSTYITKHGSSPKGPNTYANSTQVVPTSIFATVKTISPTLYNVTYTARISIGNLNSLQLQINSTTQFVSSYTFEGVFQDQTYNTALQQYQALNQSTNPCSPYVP